MINKIIFVLYLILFVCYCVALILVDMSLNIRIVASILTVALFLLLVRLEKNIK